MRELFFFVALVVFVLAIAAISIYCFMRRNHAKRYTYGDWEELIKRLSVVNRENVQTIAISAANQQERRLATELEDDLDMSQIWPMIGGMEGLEVLERNCAVLVDLVFYVQQWYPEALAIAEQLRLNAREIEWHIGRLKGAAKVGKTETSFPENAQHIIELYYTMTRKVLALYQECNLPELADLQRAL